MTVGLFAEVPIPLTTTMGKTGLLVGGGWSFFTVQCIAIIALTLLGFLGALPIVWLVNKIIPLRLDPISEEKGCDVVEHGIIDIIPSTFDSDPIKLSNVRFDESHINIPLNNIDGLYKPFNESMRHRNQGQLNQLFESGESNTNSPKLTQHL